MASWSAVFNVTLFLFCRVSCFGKFFMRNSCAMSKNFEQYEANKKFQLWFEEV